MDLEGEEKLHKFCEIARGLKIPVTQYLIPERALLVKDKLLESDALSDSTRNRLSKFNASVGCCQQFVERQAMTSVALSIKGAGAQLRRKRLKEWPM